MGRKPRILESARLRHTKAIAQLCGFDYPIKPRTYYGGVFSLYQLEQIEAKLRALGAKEVKPDDLGGENTQGE